MHCPVYIECLLAHFSKFVKALVVKKKQKKHNDSWVSIVTNAMACGNSLFTKQKIEFYNTESESWQMTDNGIIMRLSQSVEDLRTHLVHS